jgi:hypothetical protein
MKLTSRQQDVLKLMARGGVLFVRLEPGVEGMEQTCWIGTAEVLPMTVNALMAAHLIQRNKTFRAGRVVTASYVMSVAGQVALDAS